MGKDALTTLKNASEILFKMGFTKDEISTLFLDGGKKSLLVLDDAVDVMTLYFRAQKLLGDSHVREVLDKHAQLKGSASIPRDVDSLYAIESFVDTLDHALVLKNVGSGKQESIRTWENYFKEKEDKFVKDMKNKGNATRRQKNTYEAIKANPYDSRIKTYLNDYLDEQTKRDIVYAINDDEKALLVVKGLPFAVGKSKQESYADIALKYLYADSQISKYQAENMNLKALNSTLKNKVAALEASGKSISALESAIMLAIANGNKAYIDALESSNTKLADMIVANREILLASNDDLRNGLSSMIVTNGKARKNEHELQNKAHNQQHSEHKEQKELLTLIDSKLAEMAATGAEFGANNETLKKYLVELRTVVAAAGVSAATLANAKSELAAIGITNGRARKREHEAQNKILNKISKKSTIAATLAGLALAAGIGGAMFGINTANMSAEEVKAYKDYATIENAEFVDFQALLNELRAGGLTAQEEKQLLAKIDEYAKNDNIALGMPSTPSMQAILSAAKNENALADMTVKYNQVVADYEALKASGTAGTFNYVEVLNNIVNITNKLAESLDDNSLSSAEKAAIKAEIDALSTIKDDVAKQMADKFGVSLNVVMDSIDYQVADLKNQVADLNSTLDNMKAQKATDDALIASQVAKITELSNTIKALEEQLKNAGVDADLVKQLSEAKAELASAKAKIAELEAENASLEGQVATLTSQITTLNSTIARLEAASVTDAATIASLNNVIASLNRTISDLENQLANSGDAALKAELAKAKADLAAAEARVAELESENASLESTVSGLRNETAELKSEISGLKSEISGLKADNANLTSEVAQYIKEVAALNSKYDKAIADYNAKVAEYNQLLEQYNAILNSGDAAKIAELEQKLQKAGADLTAANAQINSLNNEIASLEAEVSDLTNQLAASDSGFIRELYTKLTGKSAAGLSNAEIKAYLADAFDISAGNQNSGALEDEGSTPER